MKKSYLTILPMALLASCTSELTETTDNAVKGNVERVSIQSHPFEFEDGTRTSLTATDKGISFAWANHDALGVFPISPTTNSQARQDINIPAGCEPGDAHFASFDGAGWGLKSGNTYAAYVPYDGTLPSSTPYTAVPIDLTGQDGTLATIGQKYDFMCAPSSTNEKQCATYPTHELVFDFQHVVSVLQLKLTMPVAATWASVTLTNDAGDKVWTTTATMNVETGAVTSTATASSISLALSGVATTAEGQEVVLYASVLPTTTGALTLTATTSDGDEYTASLASKALVAGKAYRYTATLEEPAPTTGTENGHAWVDLGLPSGLKWATVNVGATNPQDDGNYYAWGETEPQPNNAYSVSSYKWCNGTWDSFTKYCVDSSYGTIDNKTTLEAADDAATHNWGGAWRMPTQSDLEELVNNCYWVWTSSYNDTGKAGYIIYKAKSSSDKGQYVKSNGIPSSSYTLSDSHIFFPTAGSVANGSIRNHGTYGYWWSSSLSGQSNIYGARTLYMSSEQRSVSPNFSRVNGQSVRAVCEK